MTTRRGISSSSASNTLPTSLLHTWWRPRRRWWCRASSTPTTKEALDDCALTWHYHRAVTEVLPRQGSAGFFLPQIQPLPPLLKTLRDPASFSEVLPQMQPVLLLLKTLRRTLDDCALTWHYHRAVAEVLLLQGSAGFFLPQMQPILPMLKTLRDPASLSKVLPQMQPVLLLLKTLRRTLDDCALTWHYHRGVPERALHETASRLYKTALFRATTSSQKNRLQLLILEV